MSSDVFIGVFRLPQELKYPIKLDDLIDSGVIDDYYDCFPGIANETVYDEMAFNEYIKSFES